MLERRTASFVRSMVTGAVEDEILLPFPGPRQAERDGLQQLLTSLAPVLARHAGDYAAWDEAGALPAAYLDELRGLGLFGLTVPRHLGGLGLGAAAHARVLQELARADATTALTVGAHGSTGLRTLLLFGTEAQRARWLPALARGERLAAFCLTEEGAGSDAAAVRTSATRERDGWVLDGEKSWVANGQLAGLLTVFARTGSGPHALTAFLVPTEAPGVALGPRVETLGLRAAPTAAVRLRRVWVPDDQVLGEVGDGFRLAMKVLNAGRTALGGGAVGGMKRLIDLSLRHAAERRQFGRPLGAFGLVQQKLAGLVADCYAAESAVQLVAGLIDQGFEDTQLEAAIAKVFATEALWRAADEAMQIAGGRGFLRGSAQERLLRDSRLHRILEGTNDVLRLSLALTALDGVAAQLPEAGRGLQGVLDGALRGLGLFSGTAQHRAELAVAARRDRGRWRLLHPALAPEAAIFEEGVRGLAVGAERVLRRLGPRAAEEQLVMRRVADALIELFTLAAVLARVSTRVEDHGVEAAAPEREILRALAAQARRRVEASLAGLERPAEDRVLRAIAGHALELGRWPF
ncbi:MAG: acyl-CoA dehydrogenase family protein [Anaeromyxobacter sp.]